MLVVVEIISNESLWTLQLKNLKPRHSEAKAVERKRGQDSRVSASGLSLMHEKLIHESSQWQG